jgi:ergothioneine biosynthesis protein EgtC
MCRFVAYQGRPVLLADLLYRPRHSLVVQSFDAEQMSQPFNADGFGVGWYAPESAPFPCVVRSPTPAWASHALQSLALGVRAPRVFAHVRAATPGLAVQESNTHPFHHGRFLFMHNGAVKGFRHVRRRLQQKLADWAFESIEGSTDSEHAFALFLDEVGEPEAERDAAELRAALVAVLRRLTELTRAARVTDAMTCNFAVTDGRSTVACRFARGFPEPSSLYWSAGARYECVGDDGDVVGQWGPNTGVVIVASEPLTRHAEDWREVPSQHTLTVGPDLSVELHPIEPA